MIPRSPTPTRTGGGVSVGERSPDVDLGAGEVRWLDAQRHLG